MHKLSLCGCEIGQLPRFAGLTLYAARVRLRVRGPAGASVDAVVDTGFTTSLTLSSVVAAALGLAQQSGGSAVLADGPIRPFDVYAAEVDWGGAWRPVLA